MNTQTCPSYDNDEAMAALGRVCVDTFLHVRFNGSQESYREQIAGLLYNHTAGVCEDEKAEPTCAECGQEMAIDQAGVSNHLTKDGEIDHDADADHVAYAEEET